MKRQFLHKQYGFTLFELMIVITMFALFLAATASFDWRPRTNAERADLLMVSLASRLRTEIQNVAIGKMPQRDGNILKYTEIAIGNGGLTIVYKTGATAASPIGWKSFQSPFFEGDPKYEIAYVHWTGSTISPTLSGSAIMIIDPSGISFSGGGLSTINDNITLEFRLRYGDSTRRVYIDKRTGKITERKF